MQLYQVYIEDNLVHAHCSCVTPRTVRDYNLPVHFVVDGLQEAALSNLS